MTRTPARRAGSQVLRWAERHCPPPVIDAIVRPIVADLQFADAAATRPWQRRLIRLRAGLDLAQSLACDWLVNRRAPVKHPLVPLVRLVLMIPAALAASLAAQVLFFQGAGWLLFKTTGFSDWMTWASKVAASPFMGAAFVGAMSLVAPAERRTLVSTAAFIVVLAWGGLMIFGAFRGGASFNGWLLGIGLAGWLGGALTLLAVRMRARTRTRLG